MFAFYPNKDLDWPSLITQHHTMHNYGLYNANEAGTSPIAPMHPRPRQATSRPCCPSLRFCKSFMVTE